MEIAGVVDTDAPIDARRVGRVRCWSARWGALRFWSGFDTTVIGYIAPRICKAGGCAQERRWARS